MPSERHVTTFDESILLARPIYWLPTYALPQELALVDLLPLLEEIADHWMADGLPPFLQDVVLEDANLTRMCLNMDAGVYWNHSLVTDLILCKGVDVAWLLDTRLNNWRRSCETGSAVHVCSAGDNKEVGGVMFIAGPHLSHKRLKPLCSSGSSAALTCSFGDTLLSFIATYWPTHISAAFGSLWIRMVTSTNINPIIQLKASIAAHLDDNLLNPDRIHIIGGDFNTDVTGSDQYGLEAYMVTHRLEHVSSESDLSIKSYIRPGARVATRLDYQLIRTNTIESYSCAPIDDYPGTSGHRPLLGRFKIHCTPIPTPHKFIAQMKYRDIKLNQKEKIGDLISLLEEIELALALILGPACFTSRRH